MASFDSNQKHTKDTSTATHWEEEEDEEEEEEEIGRERGRQIFRFSPQIHSSTKAVAGGKKNVQQESKNKSRTAQYIYRLGNFTR